MRQNLNKLIFIFVIAFIASMVFAADEVATYLIINDIPPYNRLTQAFDAYTDKLKTVPGYSIYFNSAVVIAADHFVLDHSDITYETDYQSETIGLGTTVRVTKHVGADSDKWLPHEIQRDFRTYYGMPGDSYVMRVIDGHTLMAAGSGGWDYRWLSGNKAVHIESTDLMMEKPEPLEVVKAYLVKHPSTLIASTSADLRSFESKTKWIKDEMDRRLWLAGKWFYQLQLGKVQQREVSEQAVKSMNIFLDYREKYFGVKAAGEKNLLASYLNANSGTSIKSKLDEYKKWWVANKGKAINL